MANTDILDNWVRMAPLISQLFFTDVGVAVNDRERFIFYMPGKTLNLKIAHGAPVKPGMLTDTAMKERCRVVERRDAALWGVPFVGRAVPITDETGEVIGAISVQENVDRQEAMEAIAGQLSNCIDVLAASAEQITAQSQEASSSCDSIAGLVEISNTKILETNEVIEFIKFIAQNTSLLGLNAAIEAARVAEQGRGFGIVAAEIRKLAQNAADSANNINNVVTAIQNNSGSINRDVKNIKTIVAEIAAAISHVTESIFEIKDLAEKAAIMASDNLEKHEIR